MGPAASGLHHLEAHLRLALDAGRFGTWRWDRTSGATVWDRRMEELFGLEPGSFEGTYDGWISRVHPADRARVVAAVDDAVARAGTYQFEHRIMHADGTIRWLHAAGAVTTDAEGGVTGTIGCCQDVTARAEADGALKASVARLAVAAERERAQRGRLEIVVAVGELLEAEPDAARFGPRLATALVPELADRCLFRLELAPTEQQGGPPGDAADGRALQLPVAFGTHRFGTLELSRTSTRGPFTPEDEDLARAVAARLGASLDASRLRAQHERSARIDALLAELGRQLVGAADVDAVIEVALTTAPIIDADTVQVALVAAAGQLAMHAASSLAATPTRSLEQIDLLDDPDLRAAMERGERTVTHTDGDDPTVRVISPLFDEERRTVGLLIFTWHRPVAFDEVDRNAVETLTRLCGQALRRSQEAGHIEEMARLAGAFAVVRSTPEVADELRSHGTRFLGTGMVALRVLDPARQCLLTVSPSGGPAELEDRFERVQLDDVLPSTEAVRSSRPVWIEDIDDYRRRFPAAAELAASAGVSATAAVPLCASDGAVLGSAVFAWRSSMHLDAPFRSRLVALCDLAAQTLERVQLQESEHEVVRMMQRQLVPALPHVDGLDLAGRYEPATNVLGMGGDWYEVIPLGDGSVLAVVGDVVGHGVEAVATMARLQHLISGLIHGGGPIENLLPALNAMVADPEPTYATVLLLHIDPMRQRLGYQLAGHPGPLLRAPDGTVTELSIRRHPLLGRAMEPAPLDYVELQPGSAVLAYTDGLIERRGEVLDVGIGRLRRALEEAPLEAGAEVALGSLMDSLEAVTPQPAQDDVAVLLVRCAP